MPRVILSLQGTAIKEIPLLAEKTTLGRRPYNDIVIDNLAVSGEHAAFIVMGKEVFIEDRNSTNGTYVNGRAIERHQLRHGDQIEVGKYTISFVADPPARAEPPATEGNPVPVANALKGVIRIRSGPGLGRELALSKEVTTLGKPGVAVAAISRRQSGFEIALVGGKSAPTLNGQTIGDKPRALSHGDMIELAGSTMQFLLLELEPNTGTMGGLAEKPSQEYP